VVQISKLKPKQPDIMHDGIFESGIVLRLDATNKIFEASFECFLVIWEMIVMVSIYNRFQQ
jgi:hypothetical protein